MPSDSEQLAGIVRRDEGPRSSKRRQQQPQQDQQQESATGQQQFARELRLMMYGFGDDANPRPDSVEVMEEILLQYLHDLCSDAAKVSKMRGTVKVEDFIFALRKDPKKHARAEELLFRFDDLLKARKAFDTTS